MNNTETDSLAKLNKIWCNSRSGSQPKPVLHQNIDITTRHGGLWPPYFFPSCFSFKLVLNKINASCLCFSWLVHICVPTNPPILILSSSARWTSLTTLRQTPWRSWAKFDATQDRLPDYTVPKHLHEQLVTEVCNPSLFSFQIFIKISSKWNKLKFEWNSWKRWIHTWLPRVLNYYFSCEYLLPLELTW